MRFIRCLLLYLAMCSSCLSAYAQAERASPGLQPYIPTRVEWLALVCNDHVHSNLSTEHPFELRVLPSDHETMLIFVRYTPWISGTDRRVMIQEIETVREVINITAKSYGWQGWVKIKEDVKQGSS